MRWLLLFAAVPVAVAAFALFAPLKWLRKAKAPEIDAAVAAAGPYRDTATNAEEAARSAPAKQWVFAGRVFPDPADSAWVQFTDDGYSFGSIYVLPLSGRVDVHHQTVAKGKQAKGYIAAVVSHHCGKRRRELAARFQEELAKLPLAPKEP